jgi:hypothetical protein
VLHRPDYRIDDKFLMMHWDIEKSREAMLIDCLQ